jgi:toxin secretion/phage lysis holin
MISNDSTKLDYKGVFGVDGLKAIWEALSNHWFIKGMVSAALAVNDMCFFPNTETVGIIFTLIIFDTITGFLKAFKRNEVSSSGFFRFALKLLVYFILLATGSILDKVLPLPGLFSALTVMASFLAITEALSILENIAGLGYAVPAKLISLLKFTKTSYNTLDKKERVGKDHKNG